MSEMTTLPPRNDVRIGFAAGAGIAAALLFAPDRHSPRGFAPDADTTIRRLVPSPLTPLPLLATRAAECDGGNGSGAGTPARPATPPQTWVLSEDYPPSALFSSRQGRTGFSLGVDAGGHVVSCEVKRSSGTATLDGAACFALRRRASFRPARDGRGCPIPARYVNNVLWRIPAG